MVTKNKRFLFIQRKERNSISRSRSRYTKTPKTYCQYIYIYIYNLTFFEDVMSAIHARRYSPVTDISRAGRTCLAYMLAFNHLLSLLFTLPSRLSFPAGVPAGILLNIATYYLLLPRFHDCLTTEIIHRVSNYRRKSAPTLGISLIRDGSLIDWILYP